MGFVILVVVCVFGVIIVVVYFWIVGFFFKEFGIKVEREFMVFIVENRVVMDGEVLK